MAVPLHQCTKQEQRSVVRFLFSEGVKPIEIHRRMRIQYGDRCMSRTQVYEWTEKFKNGVTSVKDSPRPGPAFTAVTEDNIAAVENVIRENRRVTVNEVASLLDISVGSAHHIIHDELQFRKVCARWVPKRLTSEMKERRVDACQELLRRYEADGEAFLQRIVTGDESWVHFYEPQRKRQSMEWRHTSSPKPKKVQAQRSAGKVMLTLFWDYNGPILEHYMPRGSTVTSATYSNLLRENLKPAIRQKRRGLLTTGVCLLHDNARPHTAKATVSTIEELRFECIPHPPYSPDLAPSDFHVFGPLKGALTGTQFRDDDEVRSAVHEWLRTRPKDFFFPRNLRACQALA